MVLFLGLTAAMIPVSCLTYLLPLRKKNRFVMRFLLCTAVLLACIICFVPLYEDLRAAYVMYWTLRPFVAYLVAFFFFLICADIHWTDALYGAIFAYLTRELCYDLSQIAIRYITPGSNNQDLPFVIITLLVYAAVNIGSYFLISRRIETDGSYGMSAEQVRSPLVITALITVVKLVPLFLNNQSQQYNLYIFVQVICTVYILAALYMQNVSEKHRALEQELETQKQLWIQHEKEMEASRKNIQLLNMKYHDLKHYIAALRDSTDLKERNQALGEIEDSVRVFEHTIRTGNEVLDTILTEKQLVCEDQKIVMTCVADGALLQNMEAVDLYVLFGNAIDNAIESVSRLEDPQSRVIAITIFRFHDMIKIQIENAYRSNLTFTDDLPDTTKADAGNHGYGLKSIRRIAEKYEGTADVEAEDGMFTLHILLPMTDLQQKTER